MGMGLTGMGTARGTERARPALGAWWQDILEFGQSGFEAWQEHEEAQQEEERRRAAEEARRAAAEAAARAEAERRRAAAGTGISTLGWVGIAGGGAAVLGLLAYMAFRK